jgi:hypothetical protein
MSNLKEIRGQIIEDYIYFKFRESTEDYYTFLSDMIVLYGQKFQLSSACSGIAEFHFARLAIDLMNLNNEWPSNLRIKTTISIITNHLVKTGYHKSFLYALFLKYYDLIPSKKARISYLKNTKRNIYLPVSEFFAERLLEKNLHHFHINFNCIFEERIIDESFLGSISNHLIKYKVSLSSFIR